MAKIVGAITTSHVPAIGRAIAKNLQSEPNRTTAHAAMRGHVAGHTVGEGVRRIATRTDGRARADRWVRRLVYSVDH